MTPRRRTSSRPDQPADATGTGTTGGEGAAGGRRSHRSRGGHRGRAKRPVWLPLTLAAVVAGGGVTAYVALDDDGSDGRSVADGADHVRSVDAASPTPDASRRAAEPTRPPGTRAPGPSKSARPSDGATGTADATKEAAESRGSRAAGPQGGARSTGAADDGRPGDGAGRDSGGARDAAGDGDGSGGSGGSGGGSRPGSSRPGSDAGRDARDSGPRGDARDTPKTAPSGVTAEVLALVNEARTDAGCRPLAASGTLNRVADTYAGVLADERDLSHTGPDGSTVGDRVTRSGYTWSTVGENIARGQSDADAVMDAWLNSPGHRANILNCSFREMGLGVEQGSGGPWWTQVFATGR
ncbi:CAP domain-containing protein [Streptomyces sp. NPDC057702]|uniref:CAP domain-containing protein n=1 Tax=unclassified Streptomyces TaxID=2593676 RepID=UPI003681F1CE